MRIICDAFSDSEELPSKYTCKGVNVSPSITIRNAPDKTKSFAITIVDIDSVPEKKVHWFVFNIPARHTTIHQNYLPDLSICGETDNESTWYEGPCPIYFAGRHRIVLTVYALDTLLKVTEKCNFASKKRQIEKHTIQKAELTTFSEGTGEAITSSYT